MTEGRGNKWQGRNQHPQNTAPHAPSHRKNLLLVDHQNMEPPNFMVPEVAETEQIMKVLCAVPPRPL